MDPMGRFEVSRFFFEVRFRLVPGVLNNKKTRCNFFLFGGDEVNTC